MISVNSHGKSHSVQTIRPPSNTNDTHSRNRRGAENRYHKPAQKQSIVLFVTRHRYQKKIGTKLHVRRVSKPVTVFWYRLSAPISDMCATGINSEPIAEFCRLSHRHHTSTDTARFYIYDLWRRDLDIVQFRQKTRTQKQFQKHCRRILSERRLHPRNGKWENCNHEGIEANSVFWPW